MIISMFFARFFAWIVVCKLASAHCQGGKFSAMNKTGNTIAIGEQTSAN